MKEKPADAPSAEPARFDLMRFTPYRISVATQVLSERFSRDYRKMFGISIPDWRVLVHLAHSGGASVRDIEARVALDKVQVSRAASRLEARGLVRKRPNPEDRRLVHLSLTRKGQAMMAELVPLATTYQTEIERSLGDHFACFDAALAIIIGGNDDHLA